MLLYHIKLTLIRVQDMRITFRNHTALAITYGDCMGRFWQYHASTKISSYLACMHAWFYLYMVYIGSIARATYN